METKKGTLEQSVLDVWRAEQPETEHGSGEHSYEVGTDRYAAYTELVTPGQIREFLEEMSDEDFDSLLEEADEEFLEGIITIMSEEDVILEKGLLGKVAGGVAKLAGKGIAKTAKGVAKGVKRYGTTAGRATGLEKKVAKKEKKATDKERVKTAKKKLKDMGKNGGEPASADTKSDAPPAEVAKTAKPAAAASDKPATKKTTKPKKTAKPKLGPGGGEAKPKKGKKAFDEGEDSMTENTSLRETIINMWKEAASAAVDPNERDELDGSKGATGKGGVETAKKMKRAAEPKPMIAAEEAELDETNKNDKSDDGEGLDAVQPKAVKKKFKDRIDKDIDNDGDTDDSDKFLHKRRKAVSKAMKKDEEVTWEQAQDFKVQSMREALRKVWNIDEGELPPALKKAIDAKKKDKEEEDEDHKPGHDEDDDKKEKTLTGKKKSAVDINPSLQAQKY